MIRDSTRFAAALGALLAIWAVGATVPAPITIDDVSYQLMARDQAAGRGLEIWNGYEERPSPELQLIVLDNASQIAAHHGRLVSQYPHGYAVLAAPFYQAFGFQSLFWLNAAGGGVAVLLCAVLARQLGASGPVARLSALILVSATFFADYMVGVPPHPLVSALTLGAWLLTERALELQDRRWRPLMAGLLLSLALGLRLDTISFAPILVLVILGDARGRISQALGLLAGVLPALALLSWTNQIKFHTASPLSYGNTVSHTSGVGAYLPVVAAGLPVALALIALGRPALRARIGARRAGLGLGALALVALAVPQSRALLTALAHGSWALWGDLRDIPAAGVEPSDYISPGGAMYHWGSIKKALCQSAPWLALAPLWVASALGDSDRAARLRRLMLVPIALTALYGLRAYHGGGSLNLRYFVPALPFLSVAVALTLSELAQETQRRALALALGLIGLGIPALLAPDPQTPMDLTERFYLGLPVALSAGVAAASLSWGALRALGRPRQGIAMVTLGLVLAGLGWATALTWAYDVPRRLAIRERNLAYGEALQAALPEGGVVFGMLAEHIGLAAEVPDTRLALPPLDQGADMASLIAFHTGEGRTSLGLFSPAIWATIRRQGLDGGFQTETLWKGGGLELRRFTAPPLRPPYDRTAPQVPPSGG